jgi:phage host-nuclease inhibitor protein Gam
MKKNNRIKHIAPVIKTRVEAEETLGEIRRLTIERNFLNADREAQIKAIDDRFAPELSELNQELESATEHLRIWSEANPSEYGKLKSLELPHGTMGWRTGTPSLKTLTGWTWDRVLEKLKELKALAHYIRTKEEVDKQAIIGDRDGIGQEMLRTIGVKVVQSESFFVEPKLDEVENRQTTAA